MIKKFLAMVMCLVLMCGMGVVANAEEASSADEYVVTISESNESQVQPRYSYTNTISCSLNKSSGKARCVASVMGYSGTTTKIVIKMTLQKKTLLWWSKVQEWSSTTNSHTAAMSKTVAVESGKYRVKLVATVYSGSKSEEIEMYSQTNEF